MPISDPYADLATYLTITQEPTPSSDVEEQINSLLVSYSRQVERATGRFFNLDPIATTRVYRTKALTGPLPYDWAESENPYRFGGWTRMLSIDDLVTVTSIKIDTDMDGVFTDETALATTDYELWPNNAATGPEPKPYTGIYLPPNSNTFGFQPGALVQVVGKFGWPEVPDTIVQIVCDMVRLRRGAMDPAAAGIRSMAVAKGPSISYSDSVGNRLPDWVIEALRPYVKDESVL